ncbi:PaaI family thioesterase [Nocardioides alcanivorans]|uniref:PaaI family thioesterase n=1 Tax=Nocardioides alcanivorans TaxID=2897352 RepID=UPI001F25CF54|nr:PaaI family thioesterase [Nocardioides alcanivorans]
MFDADITDLNSDDVAREQQVAGGMAQATRGLVDAVIRSTVSDQEMLAITAEIEKLTARLRVSQIPGSFGVKHTPDGTVRGYGNAVVGLRNAVAPPVKVLQSPEGRAWADIHLGAAYEGPPGLVHGGVSALVLDQVAGEAAAAGGTPGMTGTLTLRYRRGTPLGDLRVEAWTTGHEGYKTFISGAISDAEGPTVECEGIFVLPAGPARAPSPRASNDPRNAGSSLTDL